MDEEIEYIELISEVLRGKSISRSLLELGHNDVLRQYILGKNVLSGMEKFIYRYRDAIHYIDLKLNWVKISEKFRKKVESLNRKMALLNILIVLIISSLTPFLSIFLKIRGILSIDISSFNSIEVLNSYGDIDNILNIYGVLQIIYVTYLLSNTEYFTRDVYKRVILYIMIYYILSGILRIFTNLIFS